MTRTKIKIKHQPTKKDSSADEMNRFAKYRGIGRIGQGSTLEEIVDEVRSMRDGLDDRTTEVPDNARDGDK